MPKAIVELGALRIEYEIAEDPHDYQKLVEKTWLVNRLNLAAVQEGWSPKDCLPFKENGADGNAYCGFVHMPTGQKIRFGQRKAGSDGHWYVREAGKSNSYRGPEPYIDVSKYGLQPAQDRPQLPEVTGTPRRAPQAPKQLEFSNDSPATDGQKKAIGILTSRILGTDDFGYQDQKTLFESLGYSGLNMLSESDAANLIKNLNAELNK